MFLYEPNEIRRCKRTFSHSGCVKSEAREKRWKKQSKCERALSRSLMLFSCYGNTCYAGHRTNISLASVSLIKKCFDNDMAACSLNRHLPVLHKWLCPIVVGCVSRVGSYGDLTCYCPCYCPCSFKILMSLDKSQN